MVAGPDGEKAIETDAVFVLIGGAPLTAGVRGWLRTDERGYFMTGPDLHAEADRSLVASRQGPALPRVQPARRLRRRRRPPRVDQASRLGGRRGGDGDLARAHVPRRPRDGRIGPSPGGLAGLPLSDEHDSRASPGGHARRDEGRRTRPRRPAAHARQRASAGCKLGDGDEVAVLQRERKKRLEAAEAYRGGGRDERRRRRGGRGAG